MFGLFFLAILFWIPVVTRIRLNQKQKIIYLGASMIALVPVSLFLMFSTDNLYQTYSDLGVFVEALEACFPPDEEPLPASFYETLLPNKPHMEQQLGGKILLIGEVIIFVITMILVSIIEPRLNRE